MSGACKGLRIFETHDLQDLPYLGDEEIAEQMAAAADVLLITSEGDEVPAHRVYLMRHSRVLASMFDAMTSAGGAASTSSGASAATTSAGGPQRSTRGRPKQRQRKMAKVAEGGSCANGHAADPQGRLRLETPFKEYLTSTVVDFLAMIYDTSLIADSAAERFRDDVRIASELLRLCDQLDAADCLALLDAALEEDVKRVPAPGRSDDWREVDWAVEVLLVAERWREACPGWFSAAVARTGAELALVHEVCEELLPIQQLMVSQAAQLRSDTLIQMWACAAASQRQGLGSVRHVLSNDKFKPRYDFIGSVNGQATIEVVCTIPEGIEEEDAVEVTRQLFDHGDYKWHLIINQMDSDWHIGAMAAPDSRHDQSKTCGQRLEVTCTVFGSSPKDARTTEHSILLGHEDVVHQKCRMSHMPAIDLWELRNSSKGFIRRDGTVRVELRVRSTHMDM
ncbi:hypothetical protein ABPG77_001113 [Micractinium sp. CCAP 211/92]